MKKDITAANQKVEEIVTQKVINHLKPNIADFQIQVKDDLRKIVREEIKL